MSDNNNDNKNNDKKTEPKKEIPGRTLELQRLKNSVDRKKDKAKKESC